MIDVADTIAAFDVFADRMDQAMYLIVGDSVSLIQADAMKNAPVGVEGNSTDPPGTLKASIRSTPVVGGNGVYTSKVGPTTVYGRQRELGGLIEAITGPHLVFCVFGIWIKKFQIYQEPHPYLKPAVHTATPLILARAAARVTRVIETSY
jgi:hypothetical protein